MGNIHSACARSTWTQPGARHAEGLHLGASLYYCCNLIGLLALNNSWYLTLHHMTYHASLATARMECLVREELRSWCGRE